MTANKMLKNIRLLASVPLRLLGAVGLQGEVMSKRRGPGRGPVHTGQWQ